MTEAYKAYPDNTKTTYKLGETQYFKDSMIMENASAFCTKSFFIKFCEEEVELNDLCHFRIEFDVKP